MKKLLNALLVVAAVFLLAACNNTSINKVAENIAIGYQTGDSEESVTKNLTLLKSIEEYQDASVTWSSNNDEVIAITDETGVVTRQVINVNIVLTAKLTFGKSELDITFNVKVIKADPIIDDNLHDLVFAMIIVPAETTTNLTLLATSDIPGTSIVWSSNNAAVITNSGVITRGTTDQTVVLTVTVTIVGVVKTKDYTVKVLKNTPVLDTDHQKVFDEVSLPAVATTNIDLPTTSAVVSAATLAWTSSNPAVISTAGVVTRGAEDVVVTLTLKVTINGKEESKPYAVKVLKTAGGQTLQEYTEKFDQSTVPNGYGDGNFTGVNGVVWTYVHAKDELDSQNGNYPIDGKGIILRRTDGSSSLSAVFPNGLASFSFQYRKAYTGGTPRTYKIDVTNNGTTTTHALPVFGGVSGAEATVYTFTSPQLNLSGSVTVKIYAAGDVTFNQQMTVDNFKWFEGSVGDVESTHADAFAQLTLPTSVTENITFPTTTVPNAIVTWSSNNQAAITNSGVVTRAADNVEVTMTVTVTINGVSLSENRTVIVTKLTATPEPEVPDLQEYTEKFDQSTVPNGYGDGNFTGVNGVVWTYVHAKDELDSQNGNYPIDGKGIILRRTDGSSSLSAVFPNGLASFSFQYRKAYTGGTPRTYKIDVTNNGTTTTHALPVFGGVSGAEATVYTFTSPQLNLSGSVTVKIYAAGDVTFNQQMTVDNFKWTEGAAVAPTIDGVLSKITIPTTTSRNITIPTTTTVPGATLAWVSSKPAVLSTTGVVNRGDEDIEVELTLTVSLNGNQKTEKYIVIVEKYVPPTHQDVFAEISLAPSTSVNLTLPTTSTVPGATLAWTSQTPSIISNTGVITRGDDDQPAILRLTVTLNGTQQTKDYTIIIKANGTLLSYYEGFNIEGKTGTDLQMALNNRLNTNVSIKSYGGNLNTPLIEADKHPTVANSVYTIYDGAAMANSASGSSGSSAWNKEHVIPKSWYINNGFAKNEGDVHNLRISRASINSDRGNLKFGIASGSWNKNAGGGFYPGDAHKGDSARIAMYMMTMMPNVLKIGNMIAGDNGKTLLKWHLEDPVDEFEIRRNEVLFDFQGNRNPFIDHPELAEEIWGPVGTLSTTSLVDALEDMQQLMNVVVYEDLRPREYLI